MSSIRQFFLSTVLFILSVIFAISVIEIGLRVFDSSGKWIEISKANVLRNFESKYRLRDLYPLDKNFVTYVRNQYGLRDDCKHPSEIEILTIGGSTTDQIYVPFVSTYQKVLQDRLSNEIKGFGCVTNAGVDGHSTWGHLFSFEKWFRLIPDLEPGFVLLYVGLNDANFRRAEIPHLGFDVNETQNFKEWLKGFRLIHKLLPLYRLIRQVGDNRELRYAGHKSTKYTTSDYSATSLNPLTIELSHRNTEAFRGRMLRILTYVRDMGAIPLCISQPHRYVAEINGEVVGISDVLGDGFSGLDYDYSVQSINTVLKDLCWPNYMDLYSYSFRDSHFYDGIHTTASGSEYIGNLMADYLIDNHFLGSFKSHATKE